MPLMAKPLVVPPLNAKGLVLLATGIGLCVAAIHAVSTTSTAAVAAVAGVPLVVGVAASLLTERRMLSQAAVLAASSSSWVAHGLAKGDWIWNLLSGHYISINLLLTLVGAVGGFLAVRVRPLIVEVRTQDGSICPSCAYILKTDNPRCPECGTNRNAALSGWRGLVRAFVDRIYRHRRHAYALTLAALLGLVGWDVWHLLIPARAFVDRFGATQVFASTMWPHEGFGPCATIASTEHPKRVLMIVLNLSRRADPVMQVRLGTLVPVPGSPVLLPTDGLPAVYANLSRAQALELLRDGVPGELDAAINAAADEAGWITPVVGRAYTGSYAPVRVDPGAYFPD